MHWAERYEKTPPKNWTLSVVFEIKVSVPSSVNFFSRCHKWTCVLDIIEIKFFDEKFFFYFFEILEPQIQFVEPYIPDHLVS